MENRYDEVLKVVTIPRTFTPEERGGAKECCERFKVYGSSTSTDSWKNDIELAFKIADSAEFVLKKEGIEIAYVPSVEQFPNDLAAWKCQVYWRDVLLDYGPGCYSLEIQGNVSGIDYSVVWGNYILAEYNPMRVRGIRIRSVFNNEIDAVGINMEGSGATSTIRFTGSIPEHQPKTQVRNLQTTRDRMIPISREYLFQYQVNSVAYTNTFIDRIMFHALAENECYISDHNVDAYSFEWLDKPMIVDEDGSGPEFDAPGGRMRVFKCKFGDKDRTQKAHYPIR